MQLPLNRKQRFALWAIGFNAPFFVIGHKKFYHQGVKTLLPIFGVIHWGYKVNITAQIESLRGRKLIYWHWETAWYTGRRRSLKLTKTGLEALWEQPKKVKQNESRHQAKRAIRQRQAVRPRSGAD